jgi:hypothetical protein
MASGEMTFALSRSCEVFGIQRRDKICVALFDAEAEWVIFRVRRDSERCANIDVFGSLPDKIHNSPN